MDKQNETMRLAELRRLGAAEVDSQRAIKTLQQAGYTDCGGELWKPPLGKAPDFGLEMPEPQIILVGHQDGYARGYTAEQMRDYAAAAVLREREECATVCKDAVASIWEYHDDERKEIGTAVCNNLADAIRNRSKAMNPPAKSPI